MNGFFWNLSTRKWLSAHGVDSFGKLFEFSENVNFSNLIQYCQTVHYLDIYQEIQGSVDLLKYMYLDVDPMFDAKISLVQLGFTRSARNQVVSFSKIMYCNTTLDLLEKFTDADVVSKLKQDASVNMNVLQEIICKSKIACQYYHKKNESDPLDFEKELFQLNQQLEYSQQEKEQLEEQISRIKKRIHTILYENEDYIDHEKMKQFVK